MSALFRLWYGMDLGARAARTALAPASWLFGAAVRARGLRYDHIPGAEQAAPIPVLSIGNLSVGGTGKTPMAAWAATHLRKRGAHPAIVMRGYGEDEPLVHSRLNPDIAVVSGGDRTRGLMLAFANGADCAILDDGFQHRRVQRVSDWVLVSADAWHEHLKLLPSGPLREPLSALGRADVLVVTRKAASSDRAEQIASRLGMRFPGLGVAVCHFAFESLVDPRTGRRSPLDLIKGKRVVAAAAVGEPDAFFAQVRSLGVELDERPFRDHHAYSAGDVTTLAAAAARCAGLVCTLKDAVKLAPLWPPAAAPLWYVSQIAVIERGESVLDQALEAILAARQAVTSTAGSAGPSSPPNGHRSSTAD